MYPREYPNKRWSEERRERMAALHRKRHGAPDGFCTVHGIHVPAEHGQPVRYWADWFARSHGREAAREFIIGLREERWASMPRIRDLWISKKLIGKNAELVRSIVWEAFHHAD
jgi:hypothetical protein